jgi:hypothetical protein
MAVSMTRVQLCQLSYTDLEQLSLRLHDTAEDIRNPSIAG